MSAQEKHKRFLKQFLWNSHAIKAHLICPLMIVVLSFDLLNGKARHDYKLALVFFLVAYPVLLLLSWWITRSNERAQAQYVIDYHSAPEQLRRERRRERAFAFVALMTVGWLLVYFGERGWQLKGLPAQYLGYFFLGCCLLGAAGVNIWYGGPLDPRGDPPPPQT